jgi:hypothetical protein
LPASALPTPARVEAPSPNTFFTSLPGVVAQAPAQNAPAVATADVETVLHG